MARSTNTLWYVIMGKVFQPERQFSLSINLYSSYILWTVSILNKVMKQTIQTFIIIGGSSAMVTHVKIHEAVEFRFVVIF